MPQISHEFAIGRVRALESTLLKQDVIEKLLTAQDAQEAFRMLAEAGWAIVNVDATVAAQAPKLAPYIPEMRERLAAAMGLDAGRVSVKATTEEGLGFTGSGEGMAAHAAALVEKTA